MFAKPSEDLKDLMLNTLNYAEQIKVENIVIFSKNGQAGIDLQNMIEEKKLSITLTVVLFPANEHIILVDHEGKKHEKKPNDLYDIELQKRILHLKEKKVNVIFGTLPFDNIIVPGTENQINITIKNTLNLFSSGLQLAVQAILISTDQGIYQPNDSVISIVGNVSILATATNSRMLFHPTEGMKIIDIISKVK